MTDPRTNELDFAVHQQTDQDEGRSMSWPALTREIKQVARRINRATPTIEQLEDAVMIFMRELGFEKETAPDTIVAGVHDTLDAQYRVKERDGRLIIEYEFGAEIDPLSIPDVMTTTGKALAQAMKEAQ